MFSASTRDNSYSFLGMTNVLPLAVSPFVSDDFFIDAACFLACSSASFNDNARAALRSGSSSSSLLRPFAFGLDISLRNCDCGTYPDPGALPFDSSKLISSALRRSSSKLLPASTRALRGCI